jgi:hypothetical protein
MVSLPRHVRKVPNRRHLLRQQRTALLREFSKNERCICWQVYAHIILDGFRQHVRRSQRKFLNVPARISFDQFLIQKAQPNGRRQPVNHEIGAKPRLRMS